MESNPLDSSDWQVIESLLPSDWRALAETHGLCRSQPSKDGERAKLKDPAVLLRLVLHHVALDSPLVQTTALADATGLVSVSPVALHLRMRSVAPWLADLAAAVRADAALDALDRWAGFRVFATDGTSVQRPGACGTTARVHYRLHVQTLRPQQVLVTDASEGEMLRRFAVADGDLDLLDRAYCNGRDVAHARRGGGRVIVRFNRGTMPLRDARGRPFDPIPAVLRMRRPGRVRSWSVRIDTPDGEVDGRLCAVRLSAAAAERAQQWLRREQGGSVSARDLEWAQYVVVFTDVAPERLTDERVMALVRLRWQVELGIKRDKSLGGLARLPNYRPDTIAGWLSGKVLAQELARRLVSAAPFSPGADAAAA